MHEPVKANIEQYLAGSDHPPSDFTSHLAGCAECRQQIAGMKAQSVMVRTLRNAAEQDPRPGFYARVIERIDAQRQSSMWSIFLVPAFGRRLAVASAALAMLMGLYLVGSEPSGAAFIPRSLDAHNVVLPGEDEAGPVLGAGQDQDRGAVLVNLATYRPEQ